VALRESIERFEARGVGVALCGATGDIADKLYRAHVTGTNIAPPSASLPEAIASLRAA
jgi:hypothetical protein